MALCFMTRQILKTVARMVDFTMCQDIQCPSAKECRRSIMITEADERYQSYTDFHRQDGVAMCTYFWRWPETHSTGQS